MVALQSLLDRALTWVLLIGTTFIVGVLIRREFVGSTESGQRVAQPQRIENWASLSQAAFVRGSTDARVKILEFSDLECPFCKAFHETILRVLAEHPADVAHLLVHYPIASHRHARSAAVAAECARVQGKFSEFVDSVFAQQGSLSDESWAPIASGVKVADMTAFVACLGDSSLHGAVDRGRNVGDSLGIRGTPTVIVNGWRLPAPPTESEIREFVRQALSGAELFPSHD